MTAGKAKDVVSSFSGSLAMPPYLGVPIMHHDVKFNKANFYVITGSDKEFPAYFTENFSTAYNYFENLDDRAHKAILFDPEFDVIIYSTFWDHLSTIETNVMLHFQIIRSVTL